MSPHRRKKEPPPKPLRQSQCPQNVTDESGALNRLDFFSPQFNHIDELDDSTGNYREFETLKGVVTADMRFQEQRRRSGQSEESVETEPAGSRENTSRESRDAGSPAASSVIVVSEGRVLIMAADEHKARCCAEILNSGGLSCSICIVDDSGRGPQPQAPAIHGCFGGFTVNPGAAEMLEQQLSSLAGRISGSAGRQRLCFDMVLDMQPYPSYAGEQLPLGYYDVGVDENALSGAIEHMVELKGRFSKPRFVDLRDQRCIRGRNRQLHCDKCVHVCPFAAIEEEDGELVVDHFRCQGCGACGLVCEAGAIELEHPRQEEFAADIIGRLQEWKAVHTAPTHAILLDSHLQTPASSDRDFPDDAFVYTVEEIGRLSLDTLLVLLAAGAGSIAVFCDEQRPVGLRRALAKHLSFGKEILKGLELPADYLDLYFTSSDQVDGPWRYCRTDPVALPAAFATSGFEYSADSSGSDRLRRAVDYLGRIQGKEGQTLTLSPGAPFGSLEVNVDCSLCMACVGSCPSGALSAGGNIPRLHFVEARCHQCGLCGTVCPERAIVLQPRLLPSVERARQQVVVCEVDAFGCIECGEPFAARSMIARMQQSLAGHWMFQEERQQRRLQMCVGCRTQDALVERGE